MPDMNRHGTNAHEELPACPLCGVWAWRTGGVSISGFTQICYTCKTPECRGTAIVIFCGIGFAVIWGRSPNEFDSISTPQHAAEWLNAGIRAMRSADINGCVHCDKTIPTSIILDAPAPDDALAFWGVGGWTPSAAGEMVDAAAAFSERAQSLRNHYAKTA